MPLVVELLSPQSVLDVGCGVGAWLAEFARHDVTDICGIDGDYVTRSQLEVPESAFVAHDLSTPLALSRRFDLAVCLEVAEHLTDPAGRVLVKCLGRAASAVLFSAAIPSQGGTGHINERWQSYWADLFRNEGLVAVDCLRPVLWNNDQVEYWYRQNVLLYVTADVLRSNSHLAEARDRTRDGMLSMVHPQLWKDSRTAGSSLWQRVIGRVLEARATRSHATP